VILNKGYFYVSVFRIRI